MSLLYSLQQGNMIEAQIVARLHGQRTRNVFHYVWWGDPSTDGEASLEDAAGQFDGTVGAAIREFASNEWQHEYVTMQLIKPVRYRPVPLTVNLPGEIQFGALPSGVAAVISRSAVLSGRRYQCRNFIAGVPSSYEADSILTAPGLAALDTIGVATAADILVGGGGSQLLPLTTKAADSPVPAVFQVQQYFPRRELHYQRRRAVGHGE